MTELKPCPWCGGVGTDKHENWVECYDCGAHGPMRAEHFDALNDWNSMSDKLTAIDDSTSIRFDPSLSFVAGDGRVEIKMDGTVHYHNFTPDEAAKAFWDAVQVYFTQRLKPVEDEQ